jgi:hypothetical protein
MLHTAIGVLLSAAGLLIVLVFALADVIRVGRYEGFGPDQIKGTIAGAAVLAGGLAILIASRGGRAPKP